jgi:hypothetical protein
MCANINVALKWFGKQASLLLYIIIYECKKVLEFRPQKCHKRIFNEFERYAPNKIFRKINRFNERDKDEERW